MLFLQQTVTFFPDYRLIIVQRHQQQKTNKGDQERIKRLEGLTREKTLYSEEKTFTGETRQSSSLSLFEEDKLNAISRVEKRLLYNGENNIPTPRTRVHPKPKIKHVDKPPETFDQPALPPIPTPRRSIVSASSRDVKTYVNLLQSAINNGNKQEALKHADMLMNYGAQVKVGIAPSNSQHLPFRYENEALV